jgi:signal transduction histidine kinase
VIKPLPSQAARVLRDFPLFADLPDEDLANLAAAADRVSIPPGSLLFEEGSVGDRFFVIVEGEMEVIRVEGGRTVILAVLGPGGFLSEMSLLENRPRTASARALRETSLLAIDPDAFRDLLACSSKAALTMLRTVTSRLRSTETSLVEQGRLAGLGTLAAGLAHELNNPAAAMVRSSSLLQESLTSWGERCSDLRRLSLGPQEWKAMRDLEGASFRRVERAGDGSQEGSTERESRELELEEWLEELGLDEPWVAAPILADARWDRRSLEGWLAGVPPNHRNLLLGWAAAGAGIHGLVSDIQRSAQSISAIVASVRSYSHLDRGPVQMVHIPDSISDTLAILKRKLVDGIKVVEDLPPDLPAIEAFGGELNQVWTNLIDNALDAMGAQGTLEIRARPTDQGIVVEVQDTGSGISPDIRPKIFDPFFTTKAQGSGTGLGLAITYGIVVNRHRGTIQVRSQPGRTVFEVALPARIMREPGPGPGHEG